MSTSAERRKGNKIRYELAKTNGKLAYSLDIFGDHIATREKYKSLDGMAAIHFYIVNKYRWPPSIVRTMSDEDLRFLLSEEMVGWTAPPEAVFKD